MIRSGSELSREGVLEDVCGIGRVSLGILGGTEVLALYVGKACMAKVHGDK